jgi:hypothetical protein
MPPLLGSGAQSPDRSATFDVAPGGGPAGAREGAVFCARTTSEKVVNAIRAIADSRAWFRMGRYLADSSLPSGNTSLCRFPTVAPFAATKA